MQLVVVEAKALEANLLHARLPCATARASSVGSKVARSEAACWVVEWMAAGHDEPARSDRCMMRSCLVRQRTSSADGGRLGPEYIGIYSTAGGCEAGCSRGANGGFVEG